MRITVVKGYAVESWAAYGWLRPTVGPYSPGVAVFGSRARTSALAAGGGHAHLVISRLGQAGDGGHGEGSDTARVQ